MIKLELLAPAKDFEHGKAAINHGADAVYIGAPKFSARKAAGTDIAQIEELVKYAHLYYSKVYVALNTILFDSELDEVSTLIHSIYNAGADALIIQDMGIIEMSLPPIPLFASTQTHNTTPEKVLFLEKAGFKRVILARELSLEQITEIHSNTNVDLESFVHGALCVSYSGQCYMSQSVCGRSGNRGDCAQPCRSAYDLIDANGKTITKNKHLISMKDLNLSKEIPALIKAGITSFKIEGRLKDIGYIKNIVADYRQTIDSFLETNNGYKKSSSGKSQYDFIPNPDKTFNRGYTHYNIHGRDEKLASYLTQKSLGNKVGVIKKIDGSRLIYEGETLNAGDGICFFSKNEELTGFNVNKVNGQALITSNPNDAYEGAVLYRNFDIHFENQLKQSVGNRKISIKMHLEGNEHQIHLTLTDEDENQVQITRQLQGVKANDREKAEIMLQNQLSKFGNTSFILKNYSAPFENAPFLQASQINDLRREATELLIKERMCNCEKLVSSIEPNDFPFPQNELNYRANISNKLSEQFYTRHGAKILEKAYELDSNVKEKILMETKHCIRYQLDACLLKKDDDHTLKEPLFLRDNKNTYRLKFNCKDCVMLVLKGN